MPQKCWSEIVPVCKSPAIYIKKKKKKKKKKNCKCNQAALDIFKSFLCLRNVGGHGMKIWEVLRCKKCYKWQLSKFKSRNEDQQISY